MLKEPEEAFYMRVEYENSMVEWQIHDSKK